MATDYKKRTIIPHDGDPELKLWSKGGELLATGFVRVCFGGRGPYIELDQSHVNWEAFQPVDAPHVYYEECRSRKSDVKLYCQLKKVNYADYKPGLCYISPFDVLHDPGNKTPWKLCIEALV